MYENTIKQQFSRGPQDFGAVEDLDAILEQGPKEKIKMQHSASCFEEHTYFRFQLSCSSFRSASNTQVGATPIFGSDSKAAQTGRTPLGKPVPYLNKF